MKATQATIFRSLQTHLRHQGRRMEELQITAATGKKVDRPSDDPASIRPILGARTQIRNAERHLDSMHSILDRLSMTDSTLDRAENLIVRAKEIAITTGNSAYNSDDLETFGHEIEGIRKELTAVANTEFNGRHLFGGRRENEPPFRMVKNAEGGDSVVYSGDGKRVEIEIGPNQRIEVNVPGSELFMGDSDDDGISEGTDIFEVLAELENALLDGDGKAANELLPELEEGADQMRLHRSRFGNNARRVEESVGHMEAIRTQMKETLSRYEDADLVETITSLQQQEMAMEAALRVTARISELSIMNYLR